MGRMCDDAASVGGFGGDVVSGRKCRLPWLLVIQGCPDPHQVWKGHLSYVAPHRGEPVRPADLYVSNDESQYLGA